MGWLLQLRHPPLHRLHRLLAGSRRCRISLEFAKLRLDSNLHVQFSVVQEHSAFDARMNDEATAVQPTFLYTFGPLGRSSCPSWTYRAFRFNLLPRLVQRSIESPESDAGDF